jgi:transcriptional regulator with XRE-family HTH domain
MLHEQIRDARIAHGLSQVKLAKLAQVPRSQLRKFELGHGITMSTFMKIVTQLPNLQHLTLGPADLQLKNVDLGALRSTLTQLVAAAAGVLAVIQATNPRNEQQTASAARGVRRQSPVSDFERVEELTAIAAALLRDKNVPDDEE